MVAQSVRVGIVGLGLVSASHLKGYASHPRAEVVACCDLDRARAETFARAHGILQVYTSYEEMLDRAEIDAVDIGTPTFLHAPMALAAAEEGKHIHCEKPFCRNVGEGLDACRAARRQGVKLVVGESYVFITPHIEARRLIEAGEIGRPLQIRERHGAWLERPRPLSDVASLDRSWRVDGAKSGGGDYPWIFDHAVHFFSTAEYFMLGEKIAEVYAVTAEAKPSPHRHGAAHDPYRMAEVDAPIITWKYEDASRQGVWMRAERLNGKYDHMRGFSTCVIGEKGMIEVLGEGGDNLYWQGEKVHLLLHREGKETVALRFDEGGDDVWQSEICYYSQGHINQVHHFIDSILNDVEPRYTGEDGVHAVQCTLAAIRSAREGRPVKVSEIGPDYTAY